jgi:hypothetical protein
MFSSSWAETTPNSSVDDARMREAIEKVKKRPEWEGGRYGFVTHNCQDFVSAVIKEYNNIK